MTKEELLAQIQSSDPEVRTKAWLSAGSIGGPAIGPLAKLFVEAELEVNRAARRAIWQIVRTSGAFKTSHDQRRSVISELIALLDNKQPIQLRREVLWMLSEIGTEPSDVGAIAALLRDSDLREDARCALERIPGNHSLAALKRALETAPDDFKANIVQSLRARGVRVPGFPDKKLVPTKEKNVASVSR